MAELIAGYDCVLSDLDGVVYAGDNAIPGAVAALNQATDAGIPVGYVTNNASRSAQSVAQHLHELGLNTGPEEVFGSAWAGAQLLAKHVQPGATVLVVGSEALADLVAERGFTPVRTAVDGVAAVIQGFSKDLRWDHLAQASFAIERGALWVATNTDTTIPVAEGIAPGNGSMVAAVRNATGATALVAGKPEPTLFTLAAGSLATQFPGTGTKPLVVGDRLDTDILGGNNAGMDTALVLTGIDSAASALAAPPEQRPHFVLETLAQLHQELQAVQAPVAGDPDQHLYRCGTSWARVERSAIVTSADVGVDVNAARAACALWWALHPNEAATPSSITVSAG